MTAGWMLVLLGAVIAPTPVPVGLALMAVGFYLLARDSETVRRAIRAVRRRLPPLSRALNRIKHRLPGGVRSVIEVTDPAPAE